jgi:hypothetical protein
MLLFQTIVSGLFDLDFLLPLAELAFLVNLLFPFVVSLYFRKLAILPYCFYLKSPDLSHVNSITTHNYFQTAQLFATFGHKEIFEAMMAIRRHVAVFII